MYTEYLYEDSLAHHGIKGQRWGTLNGPPYPLDYQEHSSTEKKQNPKAIIDGRVETKAITNKQIKTKAYNEKSSEESNNKKLTDKQKKIIRNAVIGIGVAAAVGVSIYAYKKNPRVRSAVDDAINKLKGKKVSELGTIDLNNKPFKNSSKNDLKSLFSDDIKPNKSFSEMDDFFSANQYNRDTYNNVGFTNNCIACALQNSVSKSGVSGYKARSSAIIDPKSGLTTDHHFNLNDIKDAFEGTKIESINKNDWSSIRKEIGSMGDGATGVIGNTRLVNGVPTRHAISFEVNNGKVKFADNQFANVYVDQLVSKGIPESKAKIMVFEKLSNLSDDFLNNTSIFDNSKDTVDFIRIDTATKLNPDKLNKLLG